MFSPLMCGVMITGLGCGCFVGIIICHYTITRPLLNEQKARNSRLIEDRDTNWIPKPKREHGRFVKR